MDMRTMVGCHRRTSVGRSAGPDRPNGWFSTRRRRSALPCVGVEAAALLGVAVAVWLGVLVAFRSISWGAALGAGASLSASAAAGDRGGFDSALLFREAWWIGLAELVALGVLAGWAIRMLPLRRAIPLLVVLTGAVVAIDEWRPRGGSNRFVSSALLIGLGGCVAAGLLLRQSDRERVSAASRARHDERLALARELHDVVAHHVTGMVVQAQAGQLVARTQPERAESTLRSIERAGSEALAAMRRVVGALRAEDGASAAATAPGSTLAELAELADHSAALGLAVHLTFEPEGDWPRDVPPELAQSVHRIVRESMTNAQRHASGATSVQILVRRLPTSLEIQIADDGRGRSPSGVAGFGLVGLAERVDALGGTFTAGPSDDGGWQVHATLPLSRLAT